MPCYDGRDSVRVIYKDGLDPRYREESEQLRRETKRLSDRCRKLTDLLCKAGRARYRKTTIPVEVLKWWDEHCKIDRAHGEPW